MKKATIFAMALMAGIMVTGGAVRVQAAPANPSVIKKVVVGNATIITIPCIPGSGEEKPENNTPQKPEIETPEEESDYHAYVLRVAELVNEERAKAGLKPLTLQEDITAAAQVRAVETVTLFSHTRPDGRHFATALKEAGVSYRGAGENIAWGQKTPEQVMKGWMNSAGHRANILNEKYTSIGIGYHQSATGVNYWSQLFTF